MIENPRVTCSTVLPLSLAISFCCMGLASAKDRGPEATAPAVRWRIVETKYRTEDVVVAGYSMRDFGLTGDGVTDVTARLQRAMDAMAAAGGGTVFVPEGRYVVKGNLRVPMGVTLRGEWQKPRPREPIRGAILMAYAGKGDEGGAPFIDLELSSGIMDLSIWYPEQNPNDIRPYPFAIRHRKGNNSTVRNVTLVNPYQGLWVQGPGVECHYFVNVYGTPLRCGMKIDYVSDIGRVESVCFSPDYWADSGLPGAPKRGGAHVRWMYDNGTGFVLHRSDWPYNFDIDIRGYATGLEIIKGPSKRAANGQFYGVNISHCRTALDAVHGGPNSFTKCILDGDEVGVRVHDSRHVGLLFNTCTITGRRKAVQSDGKACCSFQHCTFDGPVELSRGSVVATRCTFSPKERQIILGQSVEAAAIVGNRFGGKPDIVNQSGSSFIRIDHRPVPLAPLPDYRHPPVRERKPARSVLYVVTDERWGAKKDGVTDDTAAIQKALDYAGASGGGIVFLPGGSYGLRGRLSVPSGVELRGSFDVPHHGMALSRGRGSLLHVHTGKGNAKGAPVIALKERSGLRGVSFFHPEQSFDKVVPYPYLLQGQGADVYIINATASNPYQFIDLSVHRCDNHFVDYAAGGVIRTGIRVGGGSRNGRVQNTQFNLHYWFRSVYPNARKRRGAWGRLRDWVYRNQDGLVLGDCRDEVIFNTFVIPSHRGLVLTKQNGRGPNALVLGHGTDWAQYSVCVEAVGSKGVTFVNTQLVSVLAEHDSAYFLLPEAFDSEVRFINTTLWGHPRSAALVRGGRLILDQAHFARLGRGMIVRHGSLKMTNCVFAEACKFELDKPSAPVMSIANRFINGIVGRAAPDEIVSLCDTQLECTPDPEARTISVKLTNPQTVNGLRLVEANGESQNVPVRKAGRPGWMAVQKDERRRNLRYIYFVVTNPAFRDGGRRHVEISVDYFDEGDCQMALVYDSSDPAVKVRPKAPGVWKRAGTIQVGHTKQWKRESLVVHDALFSGRCNGCDMRLNVNKGVDVTIGGVTVSQIR